MNNHDNIINTDSDESEYLIHYFDQLLLEKDKLNCDISKLNLNQNTHVLYVFCLTNQKLNWKEWVHGYFGRDTKCSLFRKAKKYMIVKVIHNQVIFQNFSINNINCCIKPTFQIRADLLGGEEQIESVTNNKVITKNQTVYLLGRKFEQEEQNNLEFKSYRADVIISNPELILKIVCSMLNSGFVQSEILIGIAFDKDLGGHVISGCYGSEKKSQQVVSAIMEGCRRIKVQEKVKVNVFNCGVIQSEMCRVVSDLRIIQIMIGGLDKLVTVTPGKYYIRQNGNSVPMKLEELFGRYKLESLNDDQFIDCLKLQDSMNEEQMKKKTKNQI